MDIEIICPHCNELLYISQINCAIFRHGFFKHNLQQINPHANEDECNNLIKNSPFSFDKFETGSILSDLSVICQRLLFNRHV